MNALRKILNWYFNKRSLPYWCLLLVDCLIVFISTVIVYWVFRRSQLLFEFRYELFYTALAYTLLSCIGARIFRTYSGILRYSSFVDLLKVAYSNLFNAGLVVVLTLLLDSCSLDHVTVLTNLEILGVFVLATLVMWALRILIKTLYDITSTTEITLNTLIYGAMSGGVGIAKNIQSVRPKRFELCGFISHVPKTNHIQLMGKDVYNLDDDFKKIIHKKKIEALLVSPAREKDFRKNEELQNLFIEAGCKIFMVKGLSEARLEDGLLTEADMENMQLKEVSVEDLLPRAEIHVDLDSVAKLLCDKVVLITGSAGSIGSEMVRQIATFKPKKMILIDQAETPQHDVRLMMANKFPKIDADVIVTSISRVTRMDAIFNKYHPDYVFHAAAYKHVPMMEDNPSEAVLNNIYGTKVIADLSVKYGVKKFVMVSTDKAVNPTNVMGCSKRICEIYVQSLNRKLHNSALAKLTKNPDVISHTQFVTTRFGNVLGSNGSVIPLFKEQIKRGGPVTVTDERIVRFFMLIPEACNLVLEAGTKGNGGEIFVFDMGKPVRIADLAKRMIALSGAKNVEIQYTGLREGEKLYEEVLNELEGTKPTFNEKIRIAEVREYDYDMACKQIDELVEISKQYDNMATVKKMKEIVPEYKSNNSVYECLD